MPKLDFKEEHILLVAKWWADLLRDSAPYSNAELLSDEPPSNAKLLSDERLALAERLRQKLSPSADRIAIFEAALADLLRNTECPSPWGDRPAETWGIEGTRSVHLRVEYNASGLLLGACRISGVSDMAFPWKTHMFMGYDRAEVRKDGGAPFYLYGAPDA